MPLITGNTYPVRTAIKALGGRWDRRAQGWNVPEHNAAQARALVAGAPLGSDDGVPYRKAPRYGSYVTRFPSGHEIITNRRGRCEDAPCCGCCT